MRVSGWGGGERGAVGEGGAWQAGRGGMVSGGPGGGQGPTRTPHRGRPSVGERPC